MYIIYVHYICRIITYYILYVVFCWARYKIFVRRILSIIYVHILCTYKCT